MRTAYPFAMSVGVGRLSLLVVLVAGACSPSGEEASGSDSPPVWELAPGAFSVGGQVNDAHYTLSEVVGATRLSDGRVIIADHYVQGLRAYDASGEYLAQVGGEGEGPGEYQYIRGLGRCQQDRIVGFELNWGQKVYREDLTLVEEHPPGIPGLEGPAYEFACAPSGYAVATGWGDTRSQFEEGYFVATAPVVLLRGPETAYDFGERLSSERVGTVRSDGSPGGSGPHPFGRHTAVAIGRDRVFIGDGSDHSVEVYDLEGASLGTIEWHGPDRTIEDRHYAAYEEEQLASVEGDQAIRVRRRLEELPRLAEFPAYDRLVAGGRGELWVRTFPRPGSDDREWRVFAYDGAELGSIRVPKNWQILEIGADELLVVDRDTLGVETVRAITVRR